MPYAILKDIEQGIAALIDTDAGRALGPIVIHEEGADRGEALLESFIGGLGIDPAVMTPHKLDLYWDRFLDVIAAINPGDPDNPTADPAVEAAKAQARDEAAASAPGGETDAKAQETAETVTPGPLAHTDAPADDDGAIAAPPPGLPPTGEPTVASKVTCDKCDGFGTVANAEATGSIPCPKCEGSGQMDAP